MKKAILTIDDVPSNNTKAIVDYLNEKDITVVMFAVGEWLEKKPENAIYALQHGMILGNHSYTHPQFSSLTLEESKQEIEKCEEQLERIYQMAGVERKYRPFRFPYGDKGGQNKDALQEFLKEKGFDKLDDSQIPYAWWKESGLDKDIDTLWTFDFAEYNIRRGNDFTAEDVFKRINDPNPVSGAAILADGGYHFILFHAHDETEEMVPGYHRLFIDYLLEHGVTFDRPKFK
ncbi:MAG: polysaccharide deacetylase family protein [Butyrivibrio sp.]|nr:polysaccharide deacetylase family protein [Butyrivibrio sp.]